MRGVKLWFFDETFVEAGASASDHDKVWKTYPGVASMLQNMFSFQIWDFATTLAIPELRAFEHLIHHSCTAIMALVVLFTGKEGFCEYYAPFFAGVSEVSSPPLALMELFRMNEKFSAAFPVIDQVNKVIFAITFLSIRCVYWPVVIFDTLKSVISTRVPKLLRAVVFASSALFTGLQFYWGSIIVREAMKVR